MTANRTIPHLLRSASALAARFGAMIRERREALKLRQDDLALATGVGRRFIIDLEAGKPTCQLGKALVVAEAVGLRPLDVMSMGETSDTLPDMPDDADG
ncbi:MAG: helix-turn-helix domain-containing protein [Alphaproteobacteria bacterium]|jgi:y4mF family transcriptional regulator